MTEKLLRVYFLNLIPSDRIHDAPSLWVPFKGDFFSKVPLCFNKFIPVLFSDTTEKKTKRLKMQSFVVGVDGTSNYKAANFAGSCTNLIQLGISQ